MVTSCNAVLLLSLLMQDWHSTAAVPATFYHRGIAQHLLSRQSLSHMTVRQISEGNASGSIEKAACCPCAARQGAQLCLNMCQQSQKTHLCTLPVVLITDTTRVLPFESPALRCREGHVQVSSNCIAVWEVISGYLQSSAVKGCAC